MKQQPTARRRRLVLGPSTIDPDLHRILNGKRETHLTPTECRLLEELLLHLNQTVPSASLVRTLWGLDTRKGVHSLRVFIKSLRQKIEPLCAKPQYLLTEPRFGYRLQSPPVDS